MRLKTKSGSWLGLILLALFGSVFFSTPVFAQNKNIKVKTIIDPKQVGVGQGFNVVVEVSSNDDVDISGVKAPQIPGTEFLGQTQQSRTTGGIVLGPKGLQHSTTQTQVYVFQYAAQKTGAIVVPKIDITVDGKAFATTPGRVMVSKDAPDSNGLRARAKMLEDDDIFSSDPIDDMDDAFTKLLQRRFGGANGYQAVPNMNAQDAFAIVAEVDKTTVFKGEQITATWYLYTKAGVREIDTLKYPNLKGFWKEDIELATLLTFQPAELNGQQYNKALLASYALFPIESGKAVIDGYKAKVTVLAGFGRAITNTKSSTEIPILVKPLPDIPVTAVFSGAVGEFQMKAAAESSSVIAHQPFSIKVRIDGRGNAKQFELPNLQLPSNVELYDIKKDTKFFKDGLSYKEFEIFLIPREEGNITIPAITTTVFNPRTEQYEPLSTTAFEFRVVKGAGQQSMASNRIKKDGEGAAEALVPIGSWTQASARQWIPNFVGFAGLFGGTGVGFFIFGLVSAGYFRKPETLQESFERRFKHLKSLPGKKKWRELGVEATNLVNFVLGQMSGEGGADVHIDRLIDKLAPSVRKELGAELKSVMNRFYVLGFGPDEAVEQAVVAKDYEKDIKTLEKLMNRAIEMSRLS